MKANSGNQQVKGNKISEPLCKGQTLKTIHKNKQFKTAISKGCITYQKD